MREQINELFGTEMSRKEFLQHIGSGLLILFGISGLLKALLGQQPRGHSRGFRYGSSAYGGMRK
jgi:hypothetical protein